MLFSYDKESPEWALTEEYNYCENLTEKKILRVVLTWQTFVNQRYADKELRRNHYNNRAKKGCLRGSEMERLYKYIADAIPDDKDPAHFVACVFELWENRDSYKLYTRLELDKLAGLAFPSLKHMYNNADRLVALWLAIPDYIPKDFIPNDDLKKRDIEIIERKVVRWCTGHNKTPVEFWTDIREMKLLDARYMKYSISLVECKEEVEAFWECSIEELMAFLEKMQATLQSNQDALFLQHLSASIEYKNLSILEDE
jgi:hypothetical protein